MFGERGDDGEGDAVVGFGPAERGERVAAVVEAGGEMNCGPKRRVGWGEAIRAAAQKRAAEVLLQPSDVLTDRCGGNAQFFSGGTEAAEANRGFEGAEAVEVADLHRT